MPNIKRADQIQVGEKINFAIPLEVIARGGGQYVSSLWLKINDDKEIKLDMPLDSFLAVHDEAETDKALDAWDMTPEEKLDRLEALICQPGGIPTLEALAYLVELDLFYNSRLVELTNDLGPFVSQPETAKP